MDDGMDEDHIHNNSTDDNGGGKDGKDGKDDDCDFSEDESSDGDQSCYYHSEVVANMDEIIISNQ